MRRICTIFLLLSVIISSCANRVPQYTYEPVPYDLGVPFFPDSLNIPADNPMTVDGVRLGRFLFYDGRLSGDPKRPMSCATCHKQEHSFECGTDVFPDGRPVGNSGKKTPNVMLPLVNLVWNSNGYFWNGYINKNSGKNIETTVPMAITAPHEMDGDINLAVKLIKSDPFYRELFYKAFGTADINIDLISKAVAQFVRSLVSFNSKFDRFMAGEVRRMADLLLQHTEWRAATPAHEAHWLNLTGFALRPGTGRIGDDLRIRNAWKLWKPGPLAAKNAAVQQNWFIFWRRLAGGLSAGQQEQLAGSLARELMPKDGKPPLKKGDQTALEQWRCIASMERMSPSFKMKCLQAFLNAATKLEDAAFWPVARFVERIPLHGTEDAMIPATKLEPQARLLLEYLQIAKQPRLALLALAAAITHTGVRTLDLSDSFRKKSLDILKKHNAPEDWLQALQTDKVANSFMTDLRGDSLPLGLSFS